MCRAVHLESDDHPPLARSFDLKNFNHGPIPRFDTPHDILVNIQGILSGFLQEDLVRYRADVGFAICASGLGWIGEIALRDEVAAELLGGIGRDRA